MNVPGHFQKISEIFGRDFRKLPKTFEEDLKTPRSYTNEFKNNLRNKLDISEIIHIFTSEDMDVVSCEFYEWHIFQ